MAGDVFCTRNNIIRAANWLQSENSPSVQRFVRDRRFLKGWQTLWLGCTAHRSSVFFVKIFLNEKKMLFILCWMICPNSRASIRMTKKNGRNEVSTCFFPFLLPHREVDCRVSQVQQAPLLPSVSASKQTLPMNQMGLRGNTDWSLYWIIQQTDRTVR